MSKTATYIEINGIRYDATSGTKLASRPAFKPIDSIQKPVKQGGYDVLADTPPAMQPLQPLAAGAKPHFKPDVTRPGAAHVKAHNPAPASTLMRTAVKKPAPALKRQTKAVTRTDILIKKPAITVKPKQAIQSVHPERLHRAAATKQSEHIKKFHQPPKAVAKAASQPVEPMREATPTPVLASRAPAAQLFEAALAQTDINQQKTAAKQRSTLSKSTRRSLQITLVSLLVVAFGSLIAYHETAPITVKLAAAKAGFSAALPAYSPSGFHLGGVESAAGVVAIRYHSNSDARAYTVTEKPSNWDSSALLDQFVRQTTDNYETVQSGGNTVYVYGQHNATWVSDGVWYQVQSDDALSTQQLVQLASSL